MTTSTASEVIAYCGSCKMDLAAVVVAQVAGKLAKVQCKTCRKEHGYKPAKGINTPPPGKGKKAKASSPLSEEKPRGSSIEAEWTKLMKEVAKATRIKYSPKTKFNLSDVIDHPTFGEGIVLRLIYPDKAEVIFQNDLKILVHSK